MAGLAILLHGRLQQLHALAVLCSDHPVPYACAQMGSFFVVQGASMNRVLFGGGFVIPSASLALFNTISIISLIPIYDRIVVPLLRRCGRKLSHLQRIGAPVLQGVLW